MDGKTLLYDHRILLEEDEGSGYLDDYTSYRYLNQAAVEFNARTKALKGYQEITTVAEQTDYNLNADFMGVYTYNSDREQFIRYYDTSAYHNITSKQYEEVIEEINTDSVLVPSHYMIKDKATLPTQVTGTATSAGDATGGAATLTASASTFVTSLVSPGDIVHNTTDGSSGVVLSITSETALVCALFNGTGNDWDTNDTFVIQPQNRYVLVLDPPPSTAGHTVTVYNLKRPAPVYSDYGMFRFPTHYSNALVAYAAWLYKYKDNEPDYGDKWFGVFDRAVRQHNIEVNGNLRRKQFRVNLKNRQ